MIALVQAKSRNPKQQHDSLYQTVALGYFFRSLRTGTRLRRGTVAGTDFLIVAHTPGMDDKEGDRIVDRFYRTVMAAGAG